MQTQSHQSWGQAAFWSPSRFGVLQWIVVLTPLKLKSAPTGKGSGSGWKCAVNKSRVIACRAKHAKMRVECSHQSGRTSFIYPCSGRHAREIRDCCYRSQHLTAVNYRAQPSTAPSCRTAALLAEVSRSCLGRKQVQVKWEASVTLDSKREIKKKCNYNMPEKTD